MSLSKPFRLFDLPLLPLEQVLLLTEPRELLFFALSSEKARQLLRMFSLVKYFDVDVIFEAVKFSIYFKSGEPIKWKFTMELPVNAPVEGLLDGMEEEIGVLKLDDMSMVLWESEFMDPYVIKCSLPKEHFLDYTQRIGYLFQSICPGQRIRYLDAGKVGWDDEKVLFHMVRNTKCDNFHFDMYDQDKFLEILEKTDVKKKITLKYDRDREPNLECINNEKIRNIPQLKLVDVRNLDYLQFLELENEHLHFEDCKVNESDLNEYLKKWVNGEVTKRRTLRVTYYCWHGLDDKVFNGLTQEPVETWQKLGKPGLVRFSDNFYMNPTPQTVPDSFRTTLFKNCRGQFATVVQTHREFYFTPWDHPLPPINIPKGHRLSESFDRPFAWVVPRKV